MPVVQRPSCPAAHAVTADDGASHALRCLAVLAGLSRAERERVLRHTMKPNRIKLQGT
jgi:hypothetical protein